MLAQMKASFPTLTHELPIWNEDWEKPDPLGGKPGWELRDYVNIAVAAALVITALALLFPILPMVRSAEARLRRLNEQFQAQAVDPQALEK